MKHVLTRDERHAAYMADGYARVTGKVGVCEGPSGGGATYILPGLVEANESSVPILAINTDVSVSSRGRFTLTELDQRALMKPLTKWNAVLDRSADIPRTFRAAFDAMTTGRPGAAHIALPFDVQNGPVERSDVWGDPSLGSYPSRRVAPDPFHIELAAKLLRAAKRPVFICGGGPVIAGAQDELLELAEKLSAPVATTISGQGSISEEHQLAVGVVGSNGGTPETRSIVDQADIVVFVGCRAGSVTTERWRHPAPGAAKIIHIDVDAGTVGANYKVDVPIVADAKFALAALNDALSGLQRPLDAAAVAKARTEKFAKFNTLAASNDTPIKPERVVAELSKALDADAIVVADPGTPCPYLSAYYPVRQTGRTLFSNRAHGALGYSLAASVGAHFGRPSVKTVAVMGDGSFGMCAGELETLVRYKLPITLVVIRNAVYGWIKAGQKTGYGGALLLGGFRRHRSREGRGGLRREELEGGRPGEAGRGAEAGDRVWRPYAGGHRLPAAARGEGAGVGVGRLGYEAESRPPGFPDKQPFAFPPDHGVALAHPLFQSRPIHHGDAAAMGLDQG